MRRRYSCSDADGTVPLKALTVTMCATDILRPLGGARRTIDLVRLLLWIVAGCIVASIIYVTALERTRTSRCSRPPGRRPPASSPGSLFQALLLALGAGLVSVVVAPLLSGPSRSPSPYRLGVRLPRRCWPSSSAAWPAWPASAEWCPSIPPPPSPEPDLMPTDRST